MCRVLWRATQTYDIKVFGTLPTLESLEAHVGRMESAVANTPQALLPVFQDLVSSEEPLLSEYASIMLDLVSEPVCLTRKSGTRTSGDRLRWSLSRAFECW